VNIMQIEFEKQPVCPRCSKKKESQGHQLQIKVWNGKKFGFPTCSCGWSLDNESVSVQVPHHLTDLVKFLMECCLYQLKDFHKDQGRKVHDEMVTLDQVDFKIGGKYSSSCELQWFIYPYREVVLTPTTFDCTKVLKVAPACIADSVHAFIENGFIVTQVEYSDFRNRMRLEKKQYTVRGKECYEMARVELKWEPK
jgi:hypothetical protein